MKLSSDANTFADLRDDIVKFVRLRAELKRSAKLTTLSLKRRRELDYVVQELESLADDIYGIEAPNLERLDSK